MNRRKTDHRPVLLIVEDEPLVLDNLRKLVFETFGNRVEVVVAETVADALARVDRASASGVEFLVAVLDAKLPNEPGEQLATHPELAARIGRTMPYTQVIHITGYAQDPEVKKPFHDDLVSTRPGKTWFVSKEGTWQGPLLDRLKAIVYGELVAARLSALFSIGGRAQAYALRSRPAFRAGSPDATHELAALARDIREHWDDLDESVRHQVEVVFDVNTAKKPYAVSLR